MPSLCVSTAVARDSGLFCADQGLLVAGFPKLHMLGLPACAVQRGKGACFATQFCDCAVDRRGFGVSDLGGVERVTLLKLPRRQSTGTPQVISSECCLKRLSHGFTNVLWPEDVFLTSKGFSGWLGASQTESTIPLCSWCVLSMCDFFGMWCFLKEALTCVQVKLALKLVNTNLSCGQFSSELDVWVFFFKSKNRYQKEG